MNTLQNRPKLHHLSEVLIPQVDRYEMGSSVPVYEIAKMGSGVVKMDIVFEAGRPYEHRRLTATMCASLLREGTKTYTSEYIAEQMDFYGATLSIGASLDTITLSVVSLTKHFAALIPIITSILTEPLFAQHELDLLVNRLSERLKHDLQKNDILAYRHVTELMYGATHPYGYNSSEALYRELTVEDLKRHFEDHIHQGSMSIYIAGEVTDREKKCIKDIVNALPTSGLSTSLSISEPVYPDPNDRRREIKGTGSQATVRLGRPLFSKRHKDFYTTSFTCNLLGGFFGSRLVTNIRERMGLTYGIYSMPDTQIHSGTMMISTDVALHNVDKCLEAIYVEMERLQNDKVSDEEMTLVKNYITGNYINLFDGPFNSLRAIKSLALGRIPLDNIPSILNVVQSITADDVLNNAQRYLNRNDFWEVAVGASYH